MTEAFKVLGQSIPAPVTRTDIYTVPGSTEAIVSTITVCNTSATATSFQITVAPGGAAHTTNQFIYYDVAIPGNDTFAATLGITLATGDKVRVYATLGTLTFNLFGTEIT